MPRYRRPPSIEAAVEVAVSAAISFGEDHEFTTFCVGCRPPRGLEGDEAEAYRLETRRRILAALIEAWPEREAVPERAELLVEAIPGQPLPALRVQPLRIAGRYRKLERGISQTHFHCPVCRRRKRLTEEQRAACTACGGTGLLAPHSVERFVCGPLRRASGTRRSGFHGSGREDVDVLMLGRGRPFVVTLERPHRRTLDLEALAREIEERSDGRVTVSGLRVVDRATQKRITATHGRKQYRVVVEPVDGHLPRDAATRLTELAGVELQQRTPTRVSARRADKVRRRTLHTVDVEEADDERAVLVVTTDPGTYVKEWVSGDEGRTVPSVASHLGVACRCAQLDVLDVACDVA